MVLRTLSVSWFLMPTLTSQQTVRNSSVTGGIPGAIVGYNYSSVGQL